MPTWKIIFSCVGLYCGDGSDLGWSADKSFRSEEQCLAWGVFVLEHARPLEGFSITYKCWSEYT